MNEDLDNKRAEVTKRILESLTLIVEDDKADFPKRLESANLIRGISQDLILSLLSDKGLTENSSNLRKILSSQADKLEK